MMKIIDKYIIKKYLSTFFVMFGLFIPIGIMVDFAEKIDKFRENEVPADLILGYYTDFVWYFGSQLYPVFLFLAVIFFTSRLANNTEITAILSSGLSFQRFAKPYFISASVIVCFLFSQECSLCQNLTKTSTNLYLNILNLKIKETHQDFSNKLTKTNIYTPVVMILPEKEH